MFSRSQTARIETAPTVDTGALQAVELPDGAGAYVLHRVYQSRTAGTTTANHQCHLYEANAIDGKYQVFAADGTLASGTALYWPAMQAVTEPQLAPRFVSSDGRLYWLPKPNTTGDTWRLVVVVERVR